MLEKMINQNYDLISGTRYKLGGKRLGGSLVSRILSVLANYSFKVITNFPLSDSTTGIKMVKKDCLNQINLIPIQLVGLAHLRFLLEHISKILKLERCL